MKKLKFLSIVALALGMASCDYDLPNPPGQSNADPEGYFENSGIVINANTNAIDLLAQNNKNEFATVATIADLINFPSNDYSLEVDMQVGADDSFSNYTTVKTVLDGDNVTVNPDIFNGAIQSVITKKPGTYNVPVRFVAYAAKGSTRMRLGGINATYGAATELVTTLPAAKIIEDVYYLVPGGNIANAVKMLNTAGNDVSPYDNPEFALKIDVTEAQATSANGYTWQVISASDYEAGTLANALGCRPSEDNDMQGKLGAGYAAGSIKVMGPFLVTVNIEVDSYTVNYALDNLWPLSGTTLSKPQNALTLGTGNYINYTGVSVINQQWILCGQPDQNGAVVFKQDTETEAEVSEDGLTQTGIMTALSTGTKIRAPYKGNCLYWLDINLSQLTYSITALQTMSVIGNHNGWNLETAIPLTASKDLKTWTATDVELDGDFKVNCNGAWDIDFGGETLTDETGAKTYSIHMKGSNLGVEKGKYDVKVVFDGGYFGNGNMNYTLTLTKK